MNKVLLRRIERLEAQLKPTKLITLLWVSHRIEKSRRQSLADNERIVLDVYGEIWARERITTDPQDEGRRFAREDYPEELDQCSGDPLNDMNAKLETANPLI